MTILITMYSLVASVALGAVIAAPVVYASVTKFMDVTRFRAALALYRLPFPASRGVVLAVATAELALGVTVLVGPGPSSAAVAALGYALLAGVLERARRLGATGECGCFGALPASIDLGGVLRNAVFAALSAAIAAARWHGLLPMYDPMWGVWCVIAIALVAATCDTALAVRGSVQR
jgi:hypothetical protein